MSISALALLFSTATKQFGLPPNLVSSVCYVESRHVITAIHEDDGGSDSIGICQIKLRTAQWLGFEGTEDELLNPRVNIHYAAKYLAYNYRRYGSVQKAVIAYNRGNALGLTNTAYQLKVFKRWQEESKCHKYSDRAIK